MNKTTVQRAKRARGLQKNLTLDDIKAMLEKTQGNISEACKLLHIAKNHFYEDWRYNPEVVKLLTKLHTAGFEEVVEILYEKCLEGDINAIRTYLRYNPIAKQNNWVETQTITLKNEKPLTDSEKESLKKELFG